MYNLNRNCTFYILLSKLSLISLLLPLSYQTQETDTPPTEKKKSILVRFLAGRYWSFITNKVGKLVVIIGVFVYFCTMLEADEEQVKVKGLWKEFRGF